MKRFGDKTCYSMFLGFMFGDVPICSSRGNHRLRENRWFTCQITSWWNAKLSPVVYLNFSWIQYEYRKDNNIHLDFYKRKYWLIYRTILINFIYLRRTFILYVILLYNIGTKNYLVFIKLYNAFHHSTMASFGE